MNNEYVIINKTEILKRIEECDKKISTLQRIAHNETEERQKNWDGFEYAFK